MKATLFILIAALLSASAFGQTTYPPGTKFVAKGKTHIGGALSTELVDVRLTFQSYNNGCRLYKASGCTHNQDKRTGRSFTCTGAGHLVGFELTMPDENGAYCEIVGINDNRHWVSGYGTPSEIINAYWYYEIGPCPPDTMCKLEAKRVCEHCNPTECVPSLTKAC